MNSPLPPPHVPYVRALEAYIDAKDNTRPQRMADAFASDAELTISLATSTITFPARTGGIDAITKTLVTDFGATYTRCRTYYVCDSLRARDGAIDPLPWLVLMREPAAGALRVGHGVYRWTFDDTGSVSRFHIHIGGMDVVGDADGKVFQPDGGLALVAVLAAGAGRLERAHIALLHELLVAHPQVIDVAAALRAILFPVAAAPAVVGSI